MKTKRCTNSSCRKVFRMEILACPYCGKKYPRANACNRYAVVLTYAGPSRLPVLKAIRSATGRSIKDLRILLNNVPSLIGNSFSASQAEALKSEIRAVGSDAMIIPVSHGTKGIFVLPKRAD